MRGGGKYTESATGIGRFLAFGTSSLWDCHAHAALLEQLQIEMEKLEERVPPRRAEPLGKASTGLKRAARL